jgi:hypothetical protein
MEVPFSRLHLVGDERALRRRDDERRRSFFGERETMIEFQVTETGTSMCYVLPDGALVWGDEITTTIQSHADLKDAQKHVKQRRERNKECDDPNFRIVVKKVICETLFDSADQANN